MLNANFFISRDSSPPGSRKKFIRERFVLKVNLRKKISSVPFHSMMMEKYTMKYTEEEAYKTRSVDTDTDDGWEFVVENRGG